MEQFDPPPQKVKVRPRLPSTPSNHSSLPSNVPSSPCARKAADKLVLSHLFTWMTSRECLNEQANDLAEAFFFRVALRAHGLLGTGSTGRSFYLYLWSRLTRDDVHTSMGWVLPSVPCPKITNLSVAQSKSTVYVQINCTDYSLTLTGRLKEELILTEANH